MKKLYKVSFVGGGYRFARALELVVVELEAARRGIEIAACELVADDVLGLEASS